MNTIRKAIGFSVMAIVLTTSSPVFVGHERNLADTPYVEHERSLADDPFVGHERMGWTIAEHDRSMS